VIEEAEMMQDKEKSSSNDDEEEGNPMDESKEVPKEKDSVNDQYQFLENLSPELQVEFEIETIERLDQLKFNSKDILLMTVEERFDQIKRRIDEI
jgi:hypothetical protein